MQALIREKRGISPEIIKFVDLPDINPEDNWWIFRPDSNMFFRLDERTLLVAGMILKKVVDLTTSNYYYIFDSETSHSIFPWDIRKKLWNEDPSYSDLSLALSFEENDDGDTEINAEFLGDRGPYYLAFNFQGAGIFCESHVLEVSAKIIGQFYYTGSVHVTVNALLAEHETIIVGEKYIDV